MKKLSISQSLRKEHLRQPIDRASFDNFKIALSKLFRNINDGQREETQKEHLKTFLVESFYEDYYAASEEDIDLVVKTGSSFKNDSALLIEAKSTINSRRRCCPSESRQCSGKSDRREPLFAPLPSGR